MRWMDYSLVRDGKFLQCHGDVSKLGIIQPVDFTGQEDALRRNTYIDTPAANVIVCINLLKTLL